MHVPTSAAAPPAPAPDTDPAVRVIAVASGKGGVGKTNLAANLAVTLAERGQRVWVLDADLGLANLDVVYGVTPRRTLQHVLRGEHRLAEVVVDGPAGVRLLPAASGASELTALTAKQQLAVLEEVDALDGTLDVLLIDVAAGISSNVLYFAAAATETLVCVTPEPTALADAYALVKVLATRWNRREFPVVVNMATSARDAEEAFARLARVTAEFLPVRLELLGWVPFDEAVPRAVRSRAPVAVAAPASPAARAIAALGDRLIGPRRCTALPGGLQFFFRRLLHAEGGV